MAFNRIYKKKKKNGDGLQQKRNEMQGSTETPANLIIHFIKCKLVKIP